MKHVFGKRNKIFTFARRLNEYVYRKFALGSVDKTTKEKSVVFYPEFKDTSKLSDFLNKIHWAFPLNSGIKIYYSAEKDVVDTSQIEKYQKNYIVKNENIVRINAKQLERQINEASQIVVTKSSSRFDWAVLKNRKKTTVVDPEYFSMTEGNFWKFAYYNLLTESEKEKYRTISSENFRRLTSKSKKKDKAYVFLTGPSFESYKNFTYEKETLKIVCNTIVKDEVFMEHIGGPDIITFADSVFHFGTSTYAATFRDLVLRAVRKYGSFVVVPASTVPLLLAHYPELQPQIIGLRRANKTTFPSLEKMETYPSGSIISFMMLPMAFALSNEVKIIGADGRVKNENYFWKHNSQVQLDGLMESVFITHPSFFRDRDYADYYLKHCDYIEKIIQLAESKGIKVCSLTPSFIPALSSRNCQKTK